MDNKDIINGADKKHTHHVKIKRYPDTSTYAILDENYRLISDIKRIESLTSQRNKLLDLIYNAAIGDVSMGINIDAESLGQIAFIITGISADKVGSNDGSYNS
tara:strand:+ start:321 stop:629 length:309 start_codon:yes stop_codon:yes gene_type:complete